MGRLGNVKVIYIDDLQNVVDQSIEYRRKQAELAERIIDEEIARAVVDIAVERDIWILYDEPYKTIIYEGSHVWVSKLDWEHTISMASFSKDPGIPGWRLGYVYGPSDVIHAINLIRTYTSHTTHRR